MVSEVVLVKQEGTDLFHFKARKISKEMRIITVAILVTITLFIVFVTVIKDGNFCSI
jgi:hypothetical protein